VRFLIDAILESILTEFLRSRMTSNSLRHVSVLLEEILQIADPRSGETWIDATCGAGGHARRIAERVAPNGQLIAIDQDAEILAAVADRFEGLAVRRYHANFDQLSAVLEVAEIDKVDGLLADLGFCSDQMDAASRGLSFQQDGPLDMRLDQSQGATAADLLAREEEEELARIFKEYGEERFARKVARRIAEQREIEPILTTHQLANLVRRSVPRDSGSRIDPATRVFQGLRIAVNDELGCLERLLAELPRRLKANGRVAIISFHSLEDRLVKQAFQNQDIWETLTRKPIVPSDDEMRQNPRSRSAKLRIAKRK
jgi:16S rRNA (cytosine1402-N4)-methyltransferase